MLDHPPRKEVHEQQHSETRSSESLEHHQTVIRHAVAELAIIPGGPRGTGEAGIILFVAISYFATIRGIVNDVGDEECKHHEEDQHEK